MAKNREKTKKKAAPSILKALLDDLFVKHWLVSSLALIFLMSATLLVYKKHDLRRSTADWQSLVKEQQRQQTKWDALHLELSSLSEADRISNIAKKKLDMQEVNASNEQVISL